MRTRWIVVALVLSGFLIGYLLLRGGGDQPESSGWDSELPLEVEVVRDPALRGPPPCVDPVPSVPFEAPPPAEGDIRVEILVTGESAPIEGAAVRPGDGSLRRAETDAEGLAAITVAAEVPSLTVLVEAEGYENQIVTMGLPLPGPRHHVQLVPLTTVSGHLIWTDGTPVVGAPCQIWALHPGKREIPPIPNTQVVRSHRVPYSEAESDAAGRFELRRPDRGEFCHLQVKADGGLDSVSLDLVFDRRANTVLVPPGDGDTIVGTLTLEELYVGVLTAHRPPGLRREVSHWGIYPMEQDLDPFDLESRGRFSFQRVRGLGEGTVILRPRRAVQDPETVDLPVRVCRIQSIVVPLRVRPARRFTEKDVTHFDLDIPGGITHVIRFPGVPPEEPITVSVSGGHNGEGPYGTEATGPASGIELKLPPGRYRFSPSHYDCNVTFDRVLTVVHEGSETVIENATPRCVLDIEVLDQFGRKIPNWLITAATGWLAAGPSPIDDLTRLPPGRELLLRAARCEPRNFVAPAACNRPQRLRFVLETEDVEH